MGRKLETSSGSLSSFVVNVKDKKDQYFVGKLLAHKQTKSAYKKEDGTDRMWDIYEFSVVDTDMPTQQKINKEYVDAPVSEGSTVSIFAPTRLNNALSQAQVGETIKIVYLGLGKAAGRGGKPHTFDVEVL